MVTTATYPIAPTTTARIGTLLDAATVRDGMTWMDGTSLYDSYNCMTFGAAADFCTPTSKDFDNTVDWVDGFRFAAYGGVVCKPVGLDMARMESEVQRVFAAGESTAVERALLDTRFTENTDPDYGWDAPTDLSATAVSPATGLALLEGYAASVYVGVPTIHMPVMVASLLAATETIVRNGNSLSTKLGSKVAAGAGYDLPSTSPTGSTAANGTKWVYATGEVVVMRGPAEIRQVVDHEENDVFILAERGYVAAVDCFVVGVRVTV